jgi:hypothetical protein
MHNEWVRESVLMQIARRKLLNFKKRENEQPCNYIEKVGGGQLLAGLVACCLCLCHTCHACSACQTSVAALLHLNVIVDTACAPPAQEWTIPERLVARRPCPSAPGWEVLVKWCKLGYEQCTWEVSGRQARAGCHAGWWMNGSTVADLIVSRPESCMSACAVAAAACQERAARLSWLLSADMLRLLPRCSRRTRP